MAVQCSRSLLLLLIALTAADAAFQAESKHTRRLLQNQVVPSPLQYSPAPSIANQTGPTTVRLEIGPLRQYWPEHHGYCGEMSVQQAAAYHGYWVSQRAARWLAGGEVLFSQFEGENIVRLVEHHLGLNYTHFRRVPVADGGLQQYMNWIKTNLADGLPVIFIARLKNGETRVPGAYDHIMPMYGFTARSVDTFEPSDTFVWTSGNRNEIVRSADAPSSFADGPHDCAFNLTEGGCFNSNNLTHNYGMAIAGLPDENMIYLPMQLIVTGWEDGTSGDEEPREGEVRGNFTLNLTRAGPFPAGAVITVYRFDMTKGRENDDIVDSGQVLANPKGIGAVRELCAAAADACGRYVMRVSVPGLQVIEQAQQHLGRIRGNSVVFFVAVRGAGDAAAAATAEISSG